MEDRSPPEAETKGTSKRPSRFVSPWVIGLGLVSLLFAWLWYDGQGRVNALREEMAQRVRDSEADARDARLSARQAQEAMREALAKVAQLDLRLTEYQSNQSSLEALYQELSRSRDDWVIAEIEQVLTVASQQLQLVGNTQVALAALQTIDARLARIGRPQFLPLRKALAQDIARLKAAPSADVPSLAGKLDQMIAEVDSLALAHEARPEPPASENPTPEGFWGTLFAGALEELRQLVRIQRVDSGDSALLTPSQAYFLRENLKLRLLNARLALLARDEAAYRADLKVAAGWLARYFDPRSGSGPAMAASLKQLGSAGVGPMFPTITESLAAVRAYKVPREQAAR
jgi:uroporphyrin-III C-methyltransferase